MMARRQAHISARRKKNPDQQCEKRAVSVIARIRQSVAAAYSCYMR